ncbi:hypothetical protein AgCh_031334 [Apium graveolens]
MSKKKGGLGFRSLYGFDIALLGKHCWNFMQKYFQKTHMLRAGKGRDPSFIWAGIWEAKEALFSGFRWVLGDGTDIVAVKDPWLRLKAR